MVTKSTVRPRRRRRGVPAASSEDALRRMRSARRVDTLPELRVRSELHRLGLRFRVHRSLLPGMRRQVDIAFGPARVAVFVDGCFWHSCPLHATTAKANAAFWRAKLADNRRRDRDTDRRLEEAGWRVVRVWEHENAGTAARRVARVVRHAPGA
jgi:DNA mismatch endonuclease (patch repair protein)